jgi:hypothetical protein
VKLHAEDYVELGFEVFFLGVVWLLLPLWGPFWLLGWLAAKARAAAPEEK